MSGLRLGFSPCKGPGPSKGGCLGLPWASGSVPRSRDPTRAPLSSRLEYRLFADICILNHSVRVGSLYMLWAAVPWRRQPRLVWVSSIILNCPTHIWVPSVAYPRRLLFGGWAAAGVTGGALGIQQGICGESYHRGSPMRLPSSGCVGHARDPCTGHLARVWFRRSILAGVDWPSCLGAACVSPVIGYRPSACSGVLVVLSPGRRCLLT